MCNDKTSFTFYMIYCTERAISQVYTHAKSNISTNQHVDMSPYTIVMFANWLKLNNFIVLKHNVFKDNHNIMSFISHTSKVRGSRQFDLTHWGRMAHICVNKLTIIGSDNRLAPSHYLNQCWNVVYRYKLQCNLKRNSYIFIHENASENVICEMAVILSRPQCAKLT